MKETKENNQRGGDTRSPTDIQLANQKKTYLESISNGVSRLESAQAAGVCTTTVWNWRKRDETFAIQEETALQDRIQVVEDALYKAATTGVGGKTMVIAQIFWLKNRGKNWKDKQDVEFIMPKVVKQNTFIQAGEAPKIVEEEEEDTTEVSEEVDKNLPEVVKTL